MIGIVVSRADRASEHIAQQLLAIREWNRHEDDSRPDAAGGGTVRRSGPFELRTFDDLHLHLEGAAEAFDDPGLIVFASRHSGETGPLLTAHFTGNFGPAEFGGEDHDLAAAAPAALDRVVTAFDEHAPERYDVGIECTHHGPSMVGAPSLFVELGSTATEWDDADGARAVAAAIAALERETEDGDVETGRRTIVGFGGGHYAPRFERVLRETDWLVGHIAADWGLEALGDPREHREVIRQAFEQSDATHALLDGDHPTLAAVVADLGCRVVGETWLRETDGIPPAVVERVETILGPVDDGVRFGDPAGDVDGELSVGPLPDDLLAAALGTDADATRAAVRATVPAFETDENGTRPQGQAAVRSSADLEALADRLTDVLATAYDEVDREGGTVVARKTTFDPDLARERGVEPGPAFGKLADGEAVEGDDGAVTPREVTAERTRRFDLPWI